MARATHATLRKMMPCRDAPRCASHPDVGAAAPSSQRKSVRTVMQSVR